MQKQSGLKRFPIKYIRDRAKSAYVKEENCYVCGASSQLDLHHVYSISELFKRWCREEKIIIKTLDDILEHRDDFINQHKLEIYEDVRTLCKLCHLRLHKLFGQHPPLQTAPKQLIWIDKMKVKFDARSERSKGDEDS